MTIDAHLHLWVKDPETYPWSPIGGYIPENAASLSQFQKVMEANKIDGAVLVQPTPYGWDNSYLLDCKNTAPEKYKAVVLVDPSSKTACEELQQLEMKGADGIRINLHLRPLQDWDNNRFYELLDKCVSLKLPVCLQLTPDYLPFLKKLVAEFPTNFLIDHLGRPKTGCQPEDSHFKNLLALSTYNNVYVKLSGMNYYSTESAPYNDTWKLLKTVIKFFRYDHCMWGSDYPFVEEHWSYSENLNFIRGSLQFTDNELDFILDHTARSIWWKDER